MIISIPRSTPRQLAPALMVWLAAALIVVFVSNISRVLAQGTDEQPPKRLALRLRSFIPNAGGSLYFEPTLSGGVVRLTAIGLPAPEQIRPDGVAFFVWTVAAGEAPVRIGELVTDNNGNGGLSFARPASFERYSVLVTDEASESPQAPAGVMILASPGGAVRAFYGEKKENELSRSQRKAIEREIDRRKIERQAAHDFFAEVDDAIKQEGGGRQINLLGDEIAPEASGLALVAARHENIYVRALIQKLPSPAQVGASTYVLWAISPAGRITYMGSLEAGGASTSDTYVRVAGFSTAEVEMLVTAEKWRPAHRPSGLRALSSRETKISEGPAFGAIEGRVVDLDGRPLGGAAVEIGPVDQPVVAGTLPRTETDAEGRFFFDGIPPGTHMIYASKESEGYPATFVTFFLVDPEAVPRVTVSDKKVTENVLIRVGPKAARLVGRIVDADTSQPVEEAEITVYRADNPNNYISFGLNRGSGRFQHLIPSNPLKIKVTAPGYEDWYLDRGSEASSIINVAPDKTEELLISLRPARNK